MAGGEVPAPFPAAGGLETQEEDAEDLRAPEGVPGVQLHRDHHRTEREHAEAHAARDEHAHRHSRQREREGRRVEVSLFLF